MAPLNYHFGPTPSTVNLYSSPRSLNNQSDVARVLWRDAQGKEGSLDLSSAEIWIGRAVECAIRTDDAMVSRHHARIVWNGGAYVVQDNRSANGVFYQEQRVQEHALRHGDAVRCGSLWLRFVDGAGAQPQPAAPQPAPAPQPVSAPHPAQPSGHHPVQGAGGSDEAFAEIKRLQRRIDQLQAELRMYRGGGDAAKAKRFEDLENDFSSLEQERDMLKNRVAELEGTLRAESGDAKVQRAVALRDRAAEIVASLNDVLSNLRINVMAAEGEFEQFSDVIPRASFELIREALRSSADDMEGARDLLRQLRELAD
jgi:hypothetical protein